MKSSDLPRYTWDQAHILRLGTAAGFAQFDIAASTIRCWALDGIVTPVGKAPGGAHLYSIAEVSEAADRPRKPAGRPRVLAQPAEIVNNLSTGG